MKRQLKFVEPPTGIPSLDLAPSSNPEESMIVTLFNDALHSVEGARELKREILKVAKGDRKPYRGTTETLSFFVEADEVTIAISFDEIPAEDPGLTDVSIPSAEMVELLDQWIDHAVAAYGDRSVG